MAVREITQGQDSFLDIVANLVGVLIILVVVVGARATSSWQQPTPNENLVQQIESARSELDQSAYLSKKLERDNDKLEEKILQEDMLAVQLSERRHRELVKQEIVRQQIKQMRVSLNDVQQQRFNRQDRVASLQRELTDIQREASAITASVPKTEVIDHHPNPIAKTVFSDEIHVRLAAGRVAFVPMDALLDRMKSEWKVKSEKLRQSSRTIETVGPVGQFRLQYELGSSLMQQKTAEGILRRQVVQLNQFVLLPVRTQIGEPVSQVLSSSQNNSEILRLLARYEPRKTTVSIWVYPDSYTQHNQLKDWLQLQGFQVASWPLAEGRPISGGPNGFRTSAQ